MERPSISAGDAQRRRLIVKRSAQAATLPSITFAMEPCALESYFQTKSGNALTMRQ
jgi:hypothetical protein